MRQFENLDEQEITYLLDAPVLITFLIAGSDDHIDEKEKEWALKLVEFRSTRQEADLSEFYYEVERRWEDSFTKIAGRLLDFNNADIRNQFLTEELLKTGKALSKLSPQLSDKLYSSFRSFARQVAQASGGVFGFGAISAEEHGWLDLEMLKVPEQKE